MEPVSKVRESAFPRRRGGRMVLSVLCVVWLLSLLAGCGLGDWEYDLPNQYQVFMVNSYDIVICNFSDDMLLNNVVVGNYVSAFCYNDRYVGVQRIVPDDLRHCTVQERYEKEPAYYIVDTEKEIVFGDADEAVLGPFDEAGYEKQCADLGITDLCEWIRTYPAPDGAYYD